MKRIQLLLLGLLIVLGMHCASAGPADSGQATQTPAIDALQNGPTLVSVTLEDSPNPHVVLQTSGSPAYTSYSPEKNVFVVDLPRTAKAPDLRVPKDLPPAILSIAADQADELDSSLTRVTIRFKDAANPRTVVTDHGVLVQFDSPEEMVSIEPPLDPEPRIEVSDVLDETPPAVEPSPVPVVVQAAAPSAPAPALEPVSPVAATELRAIRTSGSGPSLKVILEANGGVDYKAFRLTNPHRIVVDLPGVRNRVKARSIPLGDPYVARVRVSQFSTSPMVTRVVLDLDEQLDYDARPTGSELRLAFGGAADEPVRVAEDVMPASSPSSPGAASSRAIRPTEQDPVASISAIAEDHTLPVAVTSHVVNAAADQQAPPRTTTLTPPPKEDVFIEPPDKGATTTRLSGTLEPTASRTLSPGEKVFTGEPIDLNLKDADIKDVLRLFAQLTGLNIAIDPQVAGSVTVDFQGVPWDQALDLILRQNGLMYQLEGNVLRVGTVARISAEKAQERQLEEQTKLNVPLTTISHKLSYAKADTVAPLLQGMASPRGKIITDTRTNQLIITEIPEYLQTMLNLIETIDIATPQVVIEARIVETTKNFLRNLGVEWGFTGALDPALGTGTGLQFPNRVNFEGGPFEFGSGNPVLSMTLGNVLGTFDLDVALTAAESEGLARIVSAPKVTAQDNESAQIESGVQIPLQTRVNFTTTVTYVNATLRLVVTPQITAEDTVILDIQVQKVEPGAVEPGAPGAPLITRRAQTKLMVRDGGTTVIGGIYQATDNNSQARVPFLHSIPIIGNLFKNQSVTKRHDELLIFITPRIVRNT